MATPSAQQQAIIDLAQNRAAIKAQNPSLSDTQVKIIAEAMSRVDKPYKVLETFDDGSELIKLSNGKMQVLNQAEGFSSSDPMVIEAAQRGESPLQAAKVQRAETIVAQDPTGARLGQFLKGLPFIGSYTDEIASSDERELASKRLQSQAMETARPGESLGLQVAGGVTGGVALGSAAAPLGGAALIDKIQSLPRGLRYLSYIASGIGLGGAEGAIYGSGEGTDTQSRIEKAQSGGLIGAGVGAATGLGLPALGDALSAGYANWRRLNKVNDSKFIAKKLGISNESATVIKNVIQQGDTDLADMLRAIDRAGEQGMIADADVATQTLLDAVAAAEGSAASIVRREVDERSRQAGRQLGATMDEQIEPVPRVGGVTADARDLATQISKASAPARGRLYSVAFQQPIDYTKPAGQRIMSILSRIDSNELIDAINKSNRDLGFSDDPVLQRMFEEGKLRQILATIDADGKVKFTDEPTIAQLDQLKRQMGELAYGAGSTVEGKVTQEARRARKIYKELSSALKEAVPIYGQAVELGGHKIAEEAALNVGMNALKKSMTPREVIRSLAELDASQMRYARVGLRQVIQDTMDNTKATIASPDLDINQVREVLRDLSSDASRSKVTAILGNAKSNALFKEIEKAKAALELRAAVAVNSKTAVRQAMQESIGQQTGTGALRSLAEGRVPTATAQVIQAVTGATGEYTAKQKAKIMREIATAITKARGQEAKKQLRQIYNAVKDDQATIDDMAKASEVLLNEVTLPASLFGVAATTRDDSE